MGAEWGERGGKGMILEGPKKETENSDVVVFRPVCVCSGTKGSGYLS